MEKRTEFLPLKIEKSLLERIEKQQELQGEWSRSEIVRRLIAEALEQREAERQAAATKG